MPFPCAFVVKLNGSKTRALVSSIPEPVSSTEITTYGPAVTSSCCDA